MNDSFSVDEAGNVVIAISVSRWQKIVKHVNTAIQLDKLAHEAWKDGKSTAALIYFDRLSNGSLARIFGMASEELKQSIRDTLTLEIQTGK